MKITSLLMNSSRCSLSMLLDFEEKNDRNSLFYYFNKNQFKNFSKIIIYNFIINHNYYFKEIKFKQNFQDYKKFCLKNNHLAIQNLL